MSGVPELRCGGIVDLASHVTNPARAQLLLQRDPHRGREADERLRVVPPERSERVVDLSEQRDGRRSGFGRR